MQHFTGVQYLKINLANTMGFDDISWEERIEKANEVLKDKEKLNQSFKEAKEPMLFIVIT